MPAEADICGTAEAIFSAHHYLNQAGIEGFISVQNAFLLKIISASKRPFD